MEKLVRSFFEKEKIEYYNSAKIDDKYVQLARKLPPYAKYVTIFLVPYRYTQEEGNVSCYAVPRDYHFYIKELEARLKKELEKCEMTENFALFADNSPFDERKLACDMHLGFVGENRLLINEKYGSYVFVAELVTEKKLDISSVALSERSECLSCGRCKKACPGGCLGGEGVCVSEITQKKTLSPQETELLKKHSLVWGCDECQKVCPHNKNAQKTPVKFFAESLLPVVSEEKIVGMSESEFSQRAYAWRGKDVILRNLRLTDIL